MTEAGSHRGPGRATGCWTIIVRALALVLTLALASPTAGLADDIAFHAGHGIHERVEVVATVDADRSGERAHPGLAGHAHCSCHVVAMTDTADVALPAAGSRRAHGEEGSTLRSVTPGRLPRPPRA